VCSSDLRLVGEIASAVAEPGAALFEAGGRTILTESARESGREILEGGVRELLEKTAPTLAAKYFPNPGAAAGAKTAASMSATTALGRVASLAGRAGMIGGLVDGGFAAVRGAVAMSRGEMSGRDAGVLVLREAGTGAASSVVGVGITAAAVATLGPLALPVLFGLGALGSIGAKFALTAMTT
jgi:hypothetical protein